MIEHDTLPDWITHKLSTAESIPGVLSQFGLELYSDQRAFLDGQIMQLKEIQKVMGDMEELAGMST